MRVTLNGLPVATDALTVAGLVGSLPDGHAVAVNGEVVPRSAHGVRPLTEGDVIELVTAVAGG